MPSKKSPCMFEKHNIFGMTNLVSLPSISLKAIWLFIIILLLLSLIFFRKEKHSISTCKISKPVFSLSNGLNPITRRPKCRTHKNYHRIELQYHPWKVQILPTKNNIIKVWLQNHRQIHFTQGPTPAARKDLRNLFWHFGKEWIPTSTPVHWRHLQANTCLF